MLKNIRYWSENYAKPGYPDKRAIEDFFECESAEIINSFKGEIVGIKDNNFSPDILVDILGKNREARHGSYTDWAKYMLVWMSEVQR